MSRKGKVSERTRGREKSLTVLPVLSSMENEQEKNKGGLFPPTPFGHSKKEE